MYTDQDYEKFMSRMHSRFPLLFDSNYGGFEIGCGWWPIVENLCSCIQSHVDWKNQQRDLYGRGQGCEQVIVRQVKEKFGSFRFYYTGGDEVVHGMVRMAEIWAQNACEFCGNRAIIRTYAWPRVLCDQHSVEYQQTLSSPK